MEGKGTITLTFLFLTLWAKCNLKSLGDLDKKRNTILLKWIEAVIFKTKKAELEYLKFLILSLQVTRSLLIKKTVES